MKLINLNTKLGVINLFSDYILKHINPKHNSIIQVTDVGHFLIINGTTDSSDLLDFSKIKDDFISEYHNLLLSVGYSENLNTMDLIKYSTKIVEGDNRYLWSTFYNSTRPLYHQEVIDASKSDKSVYSIDYKDGVFYEIDYNSYISPSKFNTIPQQITSSFPHGYSLSMGRGLLYYSEYIANQIIRPSMANKIDLFLTNRKNNEDEIMLEVKFKSSISEETIKSMILDVFSFDYDKFNKDIEGYDLCDDIKKPTEVKPWLVNDVNPKDLIVF